jgi:hypothetical protein
VARSRQPGKDETPKPRSRRSGEPPESTASSSASTSENPLGLEEDVWTPPEGPLPAEAEPEPDYRPPSQELIEWTPERCGFLVRGGGFLLHTADGLSREPEGTDLWKATEDDIDAIAPPLARILNRYEPARRLAGVADEGELALGMAAYVRRNLVERGRVAGAKHQREEALEASQPPRWPQDGFAADR